MFTTAPSLSMESPFVAWLTRHLLFCFWTMPPVSCAHSFIWFIESFSVIHTLFSLISFFFRCNLSFCALTLIIYWIDLIWWVCGRARFPVARSGAAGARHQWKTRATSPQLMINELDTEQERRSSHWWWFQTHSGWLIDLCVWLGFSDWSIWMDLATQFTRWRWCEAARRAAAMTAIGHHRLIRCPFTSSATTTSLELQRQWQQRHHHYHHHHHPLWLFAC